MYLIDAHNRLFKQIAGGWVFQGVGGFELALAMAVSGEMPAHALVFFE